MPEHLCKRHMAPIERKEKEVNFNEIESKNNTICFEFDGTSKEVGNICAV